jgi:hypothetical protein
MQHVHDLGEQLVLPVPTTQRDSVKAALVRRAEHVSGPEMDWRSWALRQHHEHVDESGVVIDPKRVSKIRHQVVCRSSSTHEQFSQEQNRSLFRHMVRIFDADSAVEAVKRVAEERSCGEEGGHRSSARKSEQHKKHVFGQQGRV